MDILYLFDIELKERFRGFYAAIEHSQPDDYTLFSAKYLIFGGKRCRLYSCYTSCVELKINFTTLQICTFFFATKFTGERDSALDIQYLQSDFDFPI